MQNHRSLVRVPRVSHRLHRFTSVYITMSGRAVITGIMNYAPRGGFEFPLDPFRSSALGDMACCPRAIVNINFGRR